MRVREVHSGEEFDWLKSNEWPAEAIVEEFDADATPRDEPPYDHYLVRVTSPSGEVVEVTAHADASMLRTEDGTLTLVASELLGVQYEEIEEPSDD